MSLICLTLLIYTGLVVCGRLVVSNLTVTQGYYCSTMVTFDATVILLSHLLIGTLCRNDGGNNTSLPDSALILLRLVGKTKGDDPFGVLTK